ncbi:MAG: MFS transporter [Planctomycetes bacterium]|nr:MFS transporter [Planctomycetota bacterium]
MAGPIIGLLADGRFPRRRVAAVALVADAALLASMAFAPSLWIFLTLRFLEGAAHILALSTLMGLASRWSDPLRRGRTMGIVGALMMLGTAMGTRLGGLVFESAPGWMFHVAAMISGTIALLAFFFAGEPPSPVAKESRSGLLGLIREQPHLLIAYAFAFIDRFCVGVVISTFVLFLESIHGFDPSARSRILLMFLLPFALLIFPAGLLVDRLGRVWTLALGNIGFGLVFALYGFASPDQLKFMMIASGVLSAIMFAPNLTLCADLVPPHRAHVLPDSMWPDHSASYWGRWLPGAIYSAISSFGASLGAFQMTFVFAGSMVALCALLTLPALLSMRRAGVTR